MKSCKFTLLSVLVVLIATVSGCKKKEDNSTTTQSKGYQGALYMEYSRDYPSFDAMVTMDVDVSPDGKLTGGPSVSTPINAEGIHYENGKPVTKLRLSGSMTLHEVEGETQVISGDEKLLVLIHSTVEACIGDASIKATLPDLEGTFTYGYTLFLIPKI
jgi:hypothetical protein